MPTPAELLATERHPELLHPPAVTRRNEPLPVADDAVLMPPFSRRVLRPTPPAVSVDLAGRVGPVAPANEMARPGKPELRLDLAEEVAGQLERMADDLRRLGFHALLEPRSEREPIDVVLASVIAGFLARR